MSSTADDRPRDETLYQHWQVLKDIAERLGNARYALQRGMTNAAETTVANLLFDVERWRDDAKADYDAF